MLIATLYVSSAVVGRTNGNLDEAHKVLEQSLMLIKTLNPKTQEPTMALGKPIMARVKPIPDGKAGQVLDHDGVVERMGFVKLLVVDHCYKRSQ